MKVSVRFAGALNDFLIPALRNRERTVDLSGPSSVKDFVEAQGVPHPEIGELRINGSRGEFDALLHDGDLVEAFPCTPCGGTPSPLPCCPAGEPRFVLDVHLGTLAGYLRLLGLDTLYRNDAGDAELAAISAEQGRILLTRDVGLLKRSVVTYGGFVRSRDPAEQLVEIVRRYGLAAYARPFTRCMRCNGTLEPVEKQAILDLLPPRTATEFEHFKQCTSCARVYWEGSHMTRMRELINKVFANEDAAQRENPGTG